MNCALPLARLAGFRKYTSRKSRVAAIRGRTRRALFAERLEDRSLMAADLVSQLQDNSALSLIAEGEAGSTLPNKASYTLQILDANGTALTSANNRTATLPTGTDFYLQLIGQDIRPSGLDPKLGTPLARGIFAAYTDILYDKTFATIATNETQSIRITGANDTGTFTLTLPVNASGKSGTTAPINFNRNDSTTTAKNIKDALNTTLFGSTAATGAKVVYDAATGRYNVTFFGINNISLPQMTSDSGDLTITELLDGAASNTLAAVQFEVNANGQVRYGNDLSASEAPFGINDVGGFTFASRLDGTPLPVLRIHMVASGASAQPIVFTPDPLGDGSQSPEDMQRPRHNTLVYGNLNVTDPNGGIDPETGGPAVVELEKSLVQYSPTNNEFLNLVGVTLAITNPVYQAVPDTGYNVSANHSAGANSVTIPVLANDTLTGFSGSPVKEIKSFDATTTGGSITKVGNDLVFTPDVDFIGTATFNYTGGVVGNNASTSVGSVTVSVAELPKKVSYTLEILDSQGNPLTSAENRTATVRNGSDFYVQLIGQDVRPAGGVRGIFAAYTDILYDKTFATTAANEAQSITIQGIDQTGSFTLTLPQNLSDKSGTTAPINFNRSDKTGTAQNIQDALNNTLFGSPTASGVKVFSTNNSTSNFKVTFAGINNISLPLMTSDSGIVQIGEIVDGAASNTVAALHDELDAAGSSRYPNGPAAQDASFGLNDVGAFASIFASGGSNPLPVVRIHMVATLPSNTPQTVVFTPDPLGDGSGSPEDMARPAHNTLVYGINDTTDELEKSLVKFSPNGNEFLNLIGVTLAINNPVYTAAPDTEYNVKENHTAGVNSIAIPVLANDTITGLPGTPVREIKSFDATTPGGTITKDGDNLIFTPNADFSGTATFTYQGGAVGDNQTSATGTVSVSVLDVNRAPTCDFGPAQSTNDEQGLTTVSGWMTNCSANDPNQTVTYTVITDKPELFTVAPTVDANGKLSFDPAPNKQGTAKVTVSIKDDGGTAHGGTDQTQVELQFTVVKLHQYFNAAETGERRGLDVTGSTSAAPDGQIVAQDALAVINYINAKGPGRIPDNAPAGAPYVDVNGDGQVIPQDVLIIINYINAKSGLPEGEASGESASPGENLDEVLALIATDIAGQPKRVRRA